MKKRKEDESKRKDKLRNTKADFEFIKSEGQHRNYKGKQANIIEFIFIHLWLLTGYVSVCGE